MPREMTVVPDSQKQLQPPLRPRYPPLVRARSHCSEVGTFANPIWFRDVILYVALTAQ